MEPVQVKIVPVTGKDLHSLQELSRSTFLATFAPDNNDRDMALYLEEHLSEQRLAAELDTEGSEFYFAMDGGNPAGYLKINTGRAQTELKGDESLEIERIYVAEAYQGSGIGQQLMAFALAVAKAKTKSFVWLGVWEHNAKAIRFYRKQGFEVFDRHIFHLGNDEQTDVMMKLVLEP